MWVERHCLYLLTWLAASGVVRLEGHDSSSQPGLTSADELHFPGHIYTVSRARRMKDAMSQ